MYIFSTYIYYSKFLKLNLKFTNLILILIPKHVLDCTVHIENFFLFHKILRNRTVTNLIIFEKINFDVTLSIKIKKKNIIL